MGRERVRSPKVHVPLIVRIPAWARRWRHFLALFARGEVWTAFHNWDPNRKDAEQGEQFHPLESVESFPGDGKPFFFAVLLAALLNHPQPRAELDGFKPSSFREAMVGLLFCIAPRRRCLAVCRPRVMAETVEDLKE